MAGIKHHRAHYLKPDILVMFGAELLRNGGNSTEAMRIAYPKIGLTGGQLNRAAAKAKATPMVQEMLAAARQRTEIAMRGAVERFDGTAEKAAAELTRLAFAQMRDVVDLSTVSTPDGKRKQVLRARDFAEISDDAHRAIAEITQKADGTVTIKLGDKQAAIMNLARLRGWIADKPANDGQQVNLIIHR